MNEELNTTGLDKLLKAFVNNPPTAKVGILGDAPRSIKKGERTTPTNAEVGALHEFGSPALGIPQRSFLRIPITDNLAKELENSGALDPDTMTQVLKKGSVTPWLKKIAVVAEGIVAEAFNSGGYGKWKPWSPGYSNNTGQILVDTQQLRNSITSEVQDA